MYVASVHTHLLMYVYAVVATNIIAPWRKGARAILTHISEVYVQAFTKHEHDFFACVQIKVAAKN